MFPNIHTVGCYYGSCYKPFQYLLEVASNDNEYKQEWIDNISHIINQEYILHNADNIPFSMYNCYRNQNNSIRQVDDPDRYKKKDWFPKSCIDTRKHCCLAHPHLLTCERLQDRYLTFINLILKSGVECYDCKQLCHKECSSIINLNRYCNSCSDKIMKFWFDVLLVTSNCN